MGTKAMDVRLARLEGAYEQIDKRLGTIEGRLAVLEGKLDGGFVRLDGKMDAEFARLDAKIDTLATELREADERLATRMDGGFARTNTRVGSLDARLNTVMFGIVVAVLVPILRVSSGPDGPRCLLVQQRALAPSLPHGLNAKA
ncbi:MAG: hypothetical protein K6W08_04410 [Firmicutes bacterium]|nr:hypothetical protein [Bacillota bacterium]